MPSSPSTQHSPHIDVYSARVPVRAVLAHTSNSNELSNSSNAALSTAWAQELWGSRIFCFESSIFGLFAPRKLNPGDLGDTPEAFNPIDSVNEKGRKEKRKLAHGSLTVKHPPGLMEDGRRAAPLLQQDCALAIPLPTDVRWRHKLSVSEPFELRGRETEGPFVEVGFATTHDYELVPAERHIGRQKTVPDWSARLHRGYAMFSLDAAVCDLTRK